LAEPLHVGVRHPSIHPSIHPSGWMDGRMDDSATGRTMRRGSRRARRAHPSARCYCSASSSAPAVRRVPAGYHWPHRPALRADVGAASRVPAQMCARVYPAPAHRSAPKPTLTWSALTNASRGYVADGRRRVANDEPCLRSHRTQLEPMHPPPPCVAPSKK
jgi:hypothetical protein